jgi:hypothetical protein
MSIERLDSPGKTAAPAESPSPAASEPQQPEARGLGRALALGAVAVSLTAVLVTQAEMVLSSVRIGYLQLPPVALGLLLFVLGLSRAARRLGDRYSPGLGRRFSLTNTELLVVYVMMLVAAMVSSHGVAEKLVPLLVIPNYFANGGNSWDTLFGPHTPQALVPYDPHGGPQQSIAADYYERLPRGMSLPWHAWVTPLLTWGVLVAIILFGFLCLASLIRRSWVDEERLSFPLAQIPVTIVTEQGGSLFGNRLFWLGALLPVSVYTINGLHQNFPAVPAIPLTHLMGDYLSVSPWNQMYYTPLLISFAAIGFFYLLPQDVLFSLWAFFVLSRLEQVGSVAVNIDQAAMASSMKFQAMGAYAVLVATLISSSKGYWKGVWRSAIGRQKADDASELLPTRVAVFGLIGAVLLSSLWLWIMGMTPWLALLEMATLLFLIAVVMARSTAEAGLLMTETTFRPIDIYSLIAPVHTLGAANITMVSFLDGMFLRDQRGLLLTGFLDGLRVADAGQASRRKLLPAFGIAVLVALVVSVGMNVVLPYHIGALNMDNWMEQGSSRWVFQDDAAFMTHPGGASPWWATSGSVLAGIAVTAVLATMRRVCFWWPLTPLGYALIGSWSTTEFWFPCLVAWIFKSLSVRYGGRKLTVQATPFFLGMVVGEFGMAVLFVVLNICFHVQAPPFPWS